jgi:hypothetical protein
MDALRTSVCSHLMNDELCEESGFCSVNVVTWSFLFLLRLLLACMLLLMPSVSLWSFLAERVHALVRRVERKGALGAATMYSYNILRFTFIAKPGMFFVLFAFERPSVDAEWRGRF